MGVIICRFSIPHEIVSDNGTQFNSKEFRAFCDELGIKKSFSLVDHPQINGQVEVIDKIIKLNLKMKLEEHKAVWAKELPKVLWAYRTTSKTYIGETTFSLAYRVEAIIPVEVGIPFLRLETYDREENLYSNSTSSTYSKRSMTLQLSESLRTKGDLKGISIPKSKRGGSRKATMFFERFCPTLRRSMLEYLGLIGKGLMS